MKREQLQSTLQELSDFFQNLEGNKVEILETLCLDRERELDPHVTLHNRFYFRVTRTGWQISGGHIFLYGESEQYGIFSKGLVAVEFAPSQVTILEQFESRTSRHSRIRLV